MTEPRFDDCPTCKKRGVVSRGEVVGQVDLELGMEGNVKVDLHHCSGVHPCGTFYTVIGRETQVYNWESTVSLPQVESAA